MIHGHTLREAQQIPSPNRGDDIIPRFIVMHYTASFNADSAVRTLTDPASRVSAHLTVDLDGTVYQHVPFNVKAWHAGPSQHMGYSGLNSHSIGIEIVNPGWFRRSGSTLVRDALRIPAARFPYVIEAPHPRVGGGTFVWPMYTNEQLAVLDRITAELLHAYPIIDIVSHEQIDTRGWKTDPGPAFPMDRYRRMLPVRDVDADTFVVTASSLRVRRGPGTEFSVKAEIGNGAEVTVQGQHGDWVRISDDGWVHGAYLRRV